MKSEMRVVACCVAGCVLAGAGADLNVAPKEGWDTLPAVRADPKDHPWWRGPDMNNIAHEGQTPPTAWGEQKNVVWRKRVPGVGYSTPCVWGGRMYVTAGDREKGDVTLYCLALETGNVVWERPVYPGPRPKMHADNAPASTTPACDGTRVFVSFQTETDLRLTAVTLEGEAAWSTVLGPYVSYQGFAVSPTVYRSLVLLVGEGIEGTHGGGYIAALHRETGEIVWRTMLGKAKELYATLVVANLAGRDQLLLAGGETTRGYDPLTGRLIWECDGPSAGSCATPAADRDTVYVAGGYKVRAMQAIRADGAGNVTKSHLRWTSDHKCSYVCTPLVFGGLLYAVNEVGLLRCYAPADGRVLWEIDFDRSFYSSPVAAGGRIYLFDREGRGYVVPPGDRPGAVTTNTLPHGVFADPVFKEGRMYLRTLGDIYCIGE